MCKGNNFPSNHVNTCARCCILSERLLSSVRLLCLLGLHRAKRPYLNSDHRQTGFWQGHGLGHNPDERGLSGPGPQYHTPAWGHWHCLAGMNTQMHSCTHTHKLELNHVKGRKDIQAAGTETYDTHVRMPARTHTVAGSHADTTSVCVMPQQTSDHRCCRVSRSGLKKTCQTGSAYVCVLRARVCPFERGRKRKRSKQGDAKNVKRDFKRSKKKKRQSERLFVDTRDKRPKSCVY